MQLDPLRVWDWIDETQARQWMQKSLDSQKSGLIGKVYYNDAQSRTSIGLDVQGAEGPFRLKGHPTSRGYSLRSSGDPMALESPREGTLPTMRL